MIASIIPKLVLVSHVLFLFFILALLFRNSFGKSVADFLGEQAVILGFLIILAAIVGSLLYSNVVGFDPCALCWWQRIFIYPQAFIFLTAIIIKDKKVFSYVVPLSVVVALIAIYHSYLQMGGTSIIPCDVFGVSCSKVLVKEFGYITIPVMSLTVAAYVFVLAWAHKLYEKNNSHT